MSDTTKESAKQEATEMPPPGFVEAEIFYGKGFKAKWTKFYGSGHELLEMLRANGVGLSAPAEAAALVKGKETPADGDGSDESLQRMVGELSTTPAPANADPLAIGNRVWVRLNHEDMYGAESGTDNVIHAKIVSADDEYISVEDIESGEDFKVDASQCYQTESQARNTGVDANADPLAGLTEEQRAMVENAAKARCDEHDRQCKLSGLRGLPHNWIHLSERKKWEQNVLMLAGLRAINVIPPAPAADDGGSEPVATQADAKPFYIDEGGDCHIVDDAPAAKVEGEKPWVDGLNTLVRVGTDRVTVLIDVPGEGHIWFKEPGMMSASVICEKLIKVLAYRGHRLYDLGRKSADAEIAKLHKGWSKTSNEAIAELTAERDAARAELAKVKEERDGWKETSKHDRATLEAELAKVKQATPAETPNGSRHFVTSGKSYLRFDSALLGKQGVLVHDDGSESPSDVMLSEALLQTERGHWKEITAEQAAALVAKPTVEFRYASEAADSPHIEPETTLDPIAQVVQAASEVLAEVDNDKLGLLNTHPDHQTDSLGIQMLRESMDRASAVVATWPEWKQNLLGRSPAQAKPIDPPSPASPEVTDADREMAREFWSLETKDPVAFLALLLAQTRADERKAAEGKLGTLRERLDAWAK